MLDIQRAGADLLRADRSAASDEHATRFSQVATNSSLRRRAVQQHAAGSR